MNPTTPQPSFNDFVKGLGADSTAPVTSSWQSQLQSKYDSTKPAVTTKTETPSIFSNYGGAVGDEQASGVKKIGSSISKGAEDINKGVEQQNMPGAMNLVKGFGNVVKGGAEAAFGTTAGAIETALAPVTPAIKGIISKFPAPEKGSPADWVMQNVVPKLDSWAQSHPDASNLTGDILTTVLTAIGGNPLESISKGALTKEGISSAVGDIKGTVAGVKDLITGAEPAAEGSISPMARSLVENAPKTTSDVLDYIKPKLTPTEEAAAKAAGRGTTEGGILNRTALKPTNEELETAKYAEEAGVSPKNTYDQNIAKMKEAQTSSAQELRQGLRESKATWNQNEIKSTLNSVEKPLTIKSDTTLNNLADNFQKAVVDMSKGIEKKPEGILDLRQNLDDLIDKEFPANIYTKDTPIGQYVRNVRQSLNRLAESKLPEGKLPSGKSIRDEWRRQHLLYKAIDNVAEKAPKVGESARPSVQRIRDFAKKHPLITAGAGTLVGERVLKKLGVPVP